MRVLCAIMVGATPLFLGGVANAHETYNEFTFERCQLRGIDCREVQAGESWEKLFLDPDRRRVVMSFNRQNTSLRVGQYIVVPAPDMTWLELSPLPLEYRHGEQCGGFLVDVDMMAAGFYDSQCRLVKWSPAIGGAEASRETMTERGSFRILQIAHEGRRSDSLDGAAIPWFLQFTRESGQGMHAGSMHGSHVSHGCVRVWADFAEWANLISRYISNVSRDQQDTLHYIGEDYETKIPFHVR